MENNYCRLEAPDYRNDYQDFLINGRAVHPWRIPGIECPQCTPWSGSRILPFDCPTECQGLDVLIEGSTVSIKDYFAITKKLKEALKTDVWNIELKPGDSFQPCVLEFPTRPISDFFWSSLGSIIVSQKVKLLFERSDIKGVEFCNAVIKTVGLMDYSDSIPMPKRGEPEDFLNIIQKEENPDKFGPLYEMVIMAESGLPPGVKVRGRCKRCGRDDLDVKHRRLVLQKKMLPDADIFFLGTTLYVIAGKKIEEILARNPLKNVKLTRIRFDD